MLTGNFKIKKTSNDALLAEYRYAFTGLFYELYNHAELLKDGAFQKEMLNKYHLINVYMLDSCTRDVEASLKAHAEDVKNKKKEIERIELLLRANNFKTKKELKHKYNLINKLARTKRNIDNDICFGSKELLRKITKAAQDAVKEEDSVEKQKKIELKEKYLSEYRSKRTTGIYIVGQAAYDGNRNFNFDLTNNKLTFKASAKNHVGIEFYSSKKDKILLAKLQKMADAKLMPLTVRITETHVLISYDEKLLHGYAFDENAYRRSLHEIGSKDSAVRKECWKVWKDEQTQRQLKGKNVNRVISVDLNPYEVGVVIADKIGNSGDFRTIHAVCFKFENLSNPLGVASDDKQQTHQNNKRKHEIKEIWAAITRLAKHYNCAYFSIEDLNFKSVSKDAKGAGFNRITKNIWHKDLTEKLIEKHCNINGIIKVEVNPCYSSFVGNMIYEDYDCVSAAKEILRRGIVKYERGNSIFPCTDRINRQKLNYLFGENVSDKDFQSWKGLYGRITAAGLRYRNKDLPCLVHNLASHKSKVRVYSCAA